MATFEEALQEIDDGVGPQPLAHDAGPPLIRDSVARLRVSVAAEQRDRAGVRGHAIELGAAALRVIRSMVDAGELPEFANPTVDRLPRMIAEYAPNTANDWIGGDDPEERWCSELAGAAEQYATANPKSASGSATARVGYLLRVVSLTAHGLSAPA
jgi:hypothetical protein